MKLRTIVLISVKGKYCELFMNGSKDVEVRKSIPRIYHKSGQRLWIYNTETKKVQFECIIEKVEKRTVQDVCSINGESIKTGLQNYELKEYAKGKEIALIHFKIIKPIKKEISINDLKKLNVRPPQSYAYIQTYPYVIPEIIV
ncbi:MAG: hypothetical protein PF448_06310 [Bacteroidales bacterium]|jgi:predicted transcriptional regulator|nr:hypothetical protein [Bacteroidales bacterium]